MALVVSLSEIGKSNLSNYESISERVEETLNDDSKPNSQDGIFLKNPSEETDENA